MRDESEGADEVRAELPVTEPALRPGGGRSPAEAPPTAPSGETLTRGASLGRYLILERLGAGGMGVVYAAYDPELDRRVAVKLLHGDHARDGGARLQREAQAMARLQHPNVIAVHDVGTLGGQVFVAMEFVEGETLGQFLSSRTLSWRDIVTLYVQAGRGLEAAHAAGLVHRDFKPENALVGRDGRVRVLDFGLARAVVDGRESAPPTTEPRHPAAGLLATPLTRVGAVMGTPAFIAPEQFEGEPADARSDQYSFGVALYGALFGRLPFVGGRLDELIAAVRAGRVEQPPEESQVPRWLRAVVMRALRTRPEERYASMSELLSALADDPQARQRARLRRVAAVGALVVAGAASWWAMGRSARLCGGARERLAGVWDAPRKAVARAAFTATGVTFAGAAWTGVERAIDDYAERWARMRSEACLATRRGEQSPELLDLRMACLDRRLAELAALSDLFAGADADMVERALPSVEALSGLDGCADSPALLAPVSPPRDEAARAKVAAMRESLARAKVLRDAGRYADGLELALQAVPAAAALGYAPASAEALTLAGSLHNHTGDFPAAEKELVDGVIAAEAANDRLIAAEAAATLVHLVGYRLSRFAEGHLWARHAEAFLNGRETPGKPEAYLVNQLGNLLHKEGRREEAVAMQRRAVELYTVASGPDSLDAANGLNSLGNALRRIGEYGEAEKTLAAALEVRERLLGPDHPLVGHSLNNLGTVAVSTGRNEEGRRLYSRALSIFERGLGADHALVAITANNLSEVAMNLGEFDEAERWMERALAIDRKNLGEQHPDVAVGLSNLAEIQMRGGKTRAALASFQKALEVKEKSLGRAHPSVAMTLMGIAQAWRRMGRADRGVPAAERALEYFSSHAAEPVDLASARWNLAQSLWDARRDRQRAVALARQARAEFAALGDTAHDDLTAVDEWLARAALPGSV